MGWVDKNLRWDAVEESLDSLAVIPQVDHIDIQVAGWIWVPTDDGSGGDNSYRVVVFQDEGHCFSQSGVKPSWKLRPLATGNVPLVVLIIHS